MRAVVFSGTTEGRMFSKQLAALGAEVLVSVATPLGAEEQGERSGITVHCGRLTPEEMTALLQGADLCVDATHPYAVEATRNIRAACKTAGTEYRRLLRPESPLPAGSMVFASAVHAAGFLARTQGNVRLPPGPRSFLPLLCWNRHGFFPVSCPPGRALPPARGQISPIRTSSPCRGRSPMR